MNPRFYEIIDTIKDGKYLYEIVKSGGQTGVRCRIYLSYEELFENELKKYDSTKYKEIFRNMLNRRFSNNKSYKFENIVWCWPYDKFDLEFGKIMANNRVFQKIQNKRKKIRNYIKHLEKYNVKKNYKF